METQVPLISLKMAPRFRLARNAMEEKLSYGENQRNCLWDIARERERGDEVRLTGTLWKKRIARQRQILPRSSGFTCGKLEWFLPSSSNKDKEVFSYTIRVQRSRLISTGTRSTSAHLGSFLNCCIQKGIRDRIFKAPISWSCLS